MNTENLNILFEDEEFQIVQPLDEVSCAEYASDTYWAIGPAAAHIYFKHYHKEGPIFIVLDKREEETSDIRKIGIHLESKVCVNVLNRNLNIKEYFEANPKVLEVIKTNASEKGKELLNVDIIEGPFNLIGYDFNYLTSKFHSMMLLRCVSKEEAVLGVSSGEKHACYEIVDTKTDDIVLWGVRGDLEKPIHDDEAYLDFISNK